MAQTTLRDYLQSTEDAISSGRVDEAFDYCQTMLTHFPESLEAQRLLGEVYLAQGHLADAQQTFDWVLTNDPENVIAYCDRALISERMADYETALDCYQQAYELSRGNSQIRQEFNVLSTKVGQQGFIFSRAGLARLYMRGDLLPQAIQEWETVLSVSPERLDARVGLLETFWREGLYDQVQQLARDVLSDVPSCLKALLLLAYVTFAQDVHASQEFLQRAEALDPELTMASELFSDLLASQPHDPFLALLQKQASPDTSAVDSQSSAAPAVASKQPTSTNGNGSHSSSEFSDSLMRWSSLDTIIEPHQDYSVLQDASPLVPWSDNQASENTPWSMDTKQEAHTYKDVEEPTLQQEQSRPVFDTWTMPGQSGDNWPPLETQSTQQAASNDGVDVEQQPSWFTDSTVKPESKAKDEAIAPWDNAPQTGSSDASVDKEEIADREPFSSPPAWLDMLTRDEQKWPPVEATLTPSTDESAPQIELPSADRAVDKQQDKTSTESQSDEEQEYFFGPEWLKSLGAESMEPIDAMDSMLQGETSDSPGSKPPVEETMIARSESEPIEEQPVGSFANGLSFDWTAAQPEWEEQMMQTDSAQTMPDVTQPPLMTGQDAMVAPPLSQEAEEEDAVLEQEERPSVASWFAQAAEKLSQPEQNWRMTLEELEKDLHAQGFTQLEPGTLATMAEEPTLSSALAQLGHYEEQPPAVEQASKTPEIAPITPVEPLWTVVPEPVAQQQPFVTANGTERLETQAAEKPPVQETQAASTSAMPSHLDRLSSFTAQPRPRTTSGELPAPEQVSQPVARVTPPAPVASTPQAATQGGGLDALLDMDLETTMKRPAVRLQPMQPQRVGTSRSSGGERLAAGKATPGDLTYKERLVKGYQFQLAGAYDNAMQEYRIIIRNAPELLGEVVSNMRALLKLTPKYSAGYRVLGDAYMRQGEYLQAMEAYNKALTIAKKAKS